MPSCVLECGVKAGTLQQGCRGPGAHHGARCDGSGPEHHRLYLGDALTGLPAGWGGPHCVQPSRGLGTWAAVQRGGKKAREPGAAVGAGRPWWIRDI